MCAKVCLCVFLSVGAVFVPNCVCRVYAVCVTYVWLRERERDGGVPAIDGSLGEGWATTMGGSVGKGGAPAIGG